jgi:DNA-binding NtrC family response regulator
MEKTRRILIVDNDEDFLTRLQVLFEDCNYQTTVAWGGREVLTELQSQRFDLILLGDYLPDVNCEEFWQDFGRLAGSASVALLETNPPVEEMARQYHQAGGHCVLSKSAPHKIVEMVRGCLSSGENYQLSQNDAPREQFHRHASAAAGQNAG